MTINAQQRHRSNRVINYVHTNFCDDIDLHRLANIACLSKYHFTRVFEAHLGQTPLRYLNRVRLERAARQLVFMPDIRVSEIATRCGFTSPYSFTRAFTRHFGYPPHKIRKLDVALDSRISNDANIGTYEHSDIRIENRPAMRIAYIRNFGLYHRDSGAIQRSSLLIKDWAESRGFERQTPFIGLCPDNRRITPAAFCIYDAGIPVTREIIEDDVVSILTIPAGRYAIAGVRCRNEMLLSAWDWLCSTWRESQAEPYEQRWNYEVFQNSYDGRLDPERGVKICLRLSD